MGKDRLYLPENLDRSTVEKVAAALLERRGHVVELDAGRVKIAGALGLQLLISTVAQWRKDSVSFSVVNPSDALIDAHHMLGISTLETGVQGSSVEELA
jgi:anti-anti-sigma regulatory factor